MITQIYVNTDLLFSLKCSHTQFIVIFTRLDEVMYPKVLRNNKLQCELQFSVRNDDVIHC